jgi:hypothetical protein
MDKKTTKVVVKKAKRRKGRLGLALPPLGLFMMESRWDYGQVSSNTSGNIAKGDISPSVSYASEYSALQSLFTEVKLIAATIVFSPVQTQGSGNFNGPVMVGTNLIFNGTTNTAPTNYSFVQNLENKKEFSVISTESKPFYYRMPVPKDLEFSAITNDIPSTATPYAGSPGTVCIFGGSLTASTGYIRVHVIGRWLFRGRI